MDAFKQALRSPALKHLGIQVICVLVVIIVWREPLFPKILPYTNWPDHILPCHTAPLKQQVWQLIICMIICLYRAREAVNGIIIIVINHQKQVQEQQQIISFCCLCIYIFRLVLSSSSSWITPAMTTKFEESLMILFKDHLIKCQLPLRQGSVSYLHRKV